MSETGDNRKRPSVAAFLFLPQFGRGFQGMSHIVPIFVRTLAIIFAQAGLVGRDHPALLYGYPGMPRCSFADLMGTAWVSLRAGRFSPRQLAVYLSVLLLCFTIGAGLTRAVVTGAFGLGEVARAQIFTLPDNAGGPRPTDTTTMPAMTPTVGAYPYDLSINNCGSLGTVCDGHDDFGIMLLDKVLRQGTHHMGGYLQNAMQAMMYVYNTGILVIAGIMLFWAVLSVIIDTAKTGTIGGGRHNMVWAPIRIVFALGLLIPLSSSTSCDTPGAVCGFSSGQLMVQKIAEWGSNLGSNAWQAYLSAAATESLTAPVVIDNATPLMQEYADMWLCRVFLNTYNWSSTQDGPTAPTGNALAPNASTIVRVRHEGAAGSGGTPTWSYNFTEQDGNPANLCGKVEIPFVLGDSSLLMGFPPTPGVTAWQNAVASFKASIIGVGSAGLGPVMGTPPVRTLAPIYPTGEEPSWNGLFNDRMNAAPGMGAAFGIGGLFLDTFARSWACDFATHFDGMIGVGAGGETGNDPAAIANSPLIRSGNCGVQLTEGFSVVQGLQLGICTEGGPGGPSINTKNEPFPDGRLHGTSYPGDGHYNCIEMMTQDYSAQINAAINAAQPALVAAFYAEIDNADRGWADMGSWHIKLTQVNSILDWAKKPHVRVTPGDLVYTDMAREVRVAVLKPEIERKVMEITHAATEWWKQQATLAAEAAPVIPINGCGVVGTPNCLTGHFTAGVAPQYQVSPATVAGGSSELGLKETVLGFLKSGNMELYLEAVMNFISAKTAPWFVHILQPGVDNMYPYVQLIQTGQAILKTGMLMVLGSSSIPAILAIMGGGIAGSSGASVGAMTGSAISGLLGVVSSTLILSGLILSFWMPLLPFVRVAFAVMAWIVSVFEAVVMIPIAALGHITTQGEGIAGHARHAWILWLNVLLRPVLTVVGYVGGIMVFNGFIVYYSAALQSAMVSSFSKGSASAELFQLVVMTIIYVGGMYIAANACFKLVDTIPNAFFKWMPGASLDTQFTDDSGQIGALMTSASRSAQGMTGAVSDLGGKMGMGVAGMFKGGGAGGAKPK